MQFYVISDNIDTRMGMRLAGIDGVVVHEEEEVRNALRNALANRSIGVILMTEKLVRLCDSLVYDIKLNRKTPLIVELTDRHGTSQITQTVSRYVSDAIGVTI